MDKAGTLVPETAELLFTGNANPFVSRGGFEAGQGPGVFLELTLPVDGWPSPAA